MEDEEPELDDDEDDVLDDEDEDDDSLFLPEPDPPELSDPPELPEPEDPEEPFEEDAGGVDELEDDRLSVR